MLYKAINHKLTNHSRQFKNQNTMKKLPILTLFLMLFVSANAQIELKNPSFEDTPKDATTPTDWTPCGTSTTPDILPGKNEWGQPIWDVLLEPMNGETYVGLIARKDNTREYIGQELSRSLKANSCYFLSLDLATSPRYAGYNKALELRIWLSNNMCEKEELIEGIVVDNYDWFNYEVIFMPSDAYEYIILEACHVDGSVLPYRGNILIDNISVIQKCGF